MFGTGMVGQALAAGLQSKGHSVTIGTRDVQKSLALTGKNAYGMPAFGAWHAANSQVQVATFADAAARAELLINATSGAVIIDLLKDIQPSSYEKLKVVKALNTITAFAMLNPSLVPGGDSTLFMCGNDAEAKAKVLALLQSYGWKDVLDLGDISNAGATELMMPIWLRVWGKLGQSTIFNYKIVR